MEKRRYSPLSDDIVDGLGDSVGVVIKTNVSKEHASAQDQSSWVGLVLALDVETDVSAAGLENGDLTAHVAARNDTWATDQTGTDVGENASVKVRHDHDVELLWPANTLHGGVVDNHVVGLDAWELLTDLLDGVAEETVGKLHDVGLVNAGNLLAVVGQGEGEGELGNALGLGAGDDLEGLDDAVDGLVLKAGVLTLGVLTDDAQVDVLVAGLVAGDVLDQDNAGVDVELLTESDVEGLVAGALDWGVKDTLQTELVALERGDRFAEELLRVLVASLHTGNINLLPLNWDIVCLENLLDRLRNLSTDTVTCSMFLDNHPLYACFPILARTWNQGDCVLAAELGRLEDVAADGGVRCSEKSQRL